MIAMFADERPMLRALAVTHVAVLAFSAALAEAAPRDTIATEAALMSLEANAPVPTPNPAYKCAKCKDTGYIVHGDGHKTRCPDCNAGDAQIFGGPIDTIREAKELIAKGRALADRTKAILDAAEREGKVSVDVKLPGHVTGSAPACGGDCAACPLPCAQPPGPAAVERRVYGYAEGQRLAAETGRPLLIVCGATWCGPCKAVDRDLVPRLLAIPVLADVVIAHLDVDQWPEITAAVCKEKAVPQFVLYRPNPAGGTWRWRVVGSTTVEAIERMVSGEAPKATARQTSGCAACSGGR
jgi:Zn finger protein HypA/HybF involved in hydrogenase expression